MKKYLFAIVLVLVPTFAIAQGTPTGFDLSNYGVSIDPDPRLMAVLATIEAGRTLDADGNPVPVISTPLSSGGNEFRDLLKSDLAALNDELRLKIGSFLLRYKRSRPNATDAELVAPFITMAYALTPVPELNDPVVTMDLPGSLLDVLDFAPLVRDFYRRSTFAANLPDYLKRYREATDAKLRPSAGEMVRELLNYLRTRPQTVSIERVQTDAQRTRARGTTIRTIEERERERRFIIVPEMLAPAGTVSFVNIRDDYYVVIPPDTDLSFSEVRRGYLQYVIDPIVLNNSRAVNEIRDGVRQVLEERRKRDPSISPDVYLAISRSLVAAIDTKQLENERIGIATARARQRIDELQTAEEKLKISAQLEELKREFADDTVLRLAEDYEKGMILSFYFAEQLRGIEDAGVDIAASMREMMLSFDPAKESGRLEKTDEARKRALAVREKRRSAETAAVLIENPVTTKLLEIQETIANKNYPKAEADLKRLLAENPGEARIFYTVGRVASLSAQALDDEDELQAKLLEAKVAYENVLRIAEVQRVDPALVSLTYVALGRIYEFYGDTSYAIGIYDKAIQIGPVQGGAHGEALTAKQRLLKQQ
ncbi:MAG TPA: hypothetical protein PKD24_02370 [Pyrinomonadaceae bacterium]|nr:hypothetical protein [Pyrinomonadaceae bacterium]HMP63996.1 hypothetical protein [Pyrinomonadaceae bacterium]